MARDRITEGDLKGLCDRLNRLTNSPMVPYAFDAAKDKHCAQVGNYHISHAYGGVCLYRMHNKFGGIRTVLMGGHVPKRELYERMYAFIAGIEEGRS